MKSEIELARAREERSTLLAAEARYARERFDLYKAKAYVWLTGGPGPAFVSGGLTRRRRRSRR